MTVLSWFWRAVTIAEENVNPSRQNRVIRE
jgi:hypothetical protein